MAAVWPKMAVEEGNLFVQISTLRAILDGEQSGQSCIQTVTGRGYRFIAPVKRCPGPVEKREARRPFRSSSSHSPISAAIPRQDYFADGVTESLTTDLSRISGAFVIGRSTAFTYKGKAGRRSSRSGASSMCATCSKAACSAAGTACASTCS